MQSHKLFLPVLLVFALLVGGCTSLGAIEKRSQEAVLVNGTPNVTIENFNGNIDIVTGPEGKVSADVRKHASTAADLDKMDFAFSQNGMDVRARASWNSDEPNIGGGVDLRIAVPAGSDIAVTVGNGRVDYRAQPGKSIEITTGNGNITVALPRDAQFSVRAGVGNGEVRSDFKLNGSNRQSGRNLSGSVGNDPALMLGLSAGNGDIRIESAR